MLVDSHCHLNYKGMAEQQAVLLERARASGVTAMLNISTRASEWDDVTATAHREADVWASFGIHPHEADAHPVGDQRREPSTEEARQFQQLIAKSQLGIDL